MDADATPEFDAFFSHDWGEDELGRNNHERVASVKRSLEQDHGLRIWSDEDQMSRDRAATESAMVNGIKTSKFVVIFITKRYSDNVELEIVGDSCRAELNVALRFKPTAILPVVMEPQMTNHHLWSSSLGCLTQQVYIDASSDDVILFQHACGELAARLKGVTPNSAPSSKGVDRANAVEEAVATMLKQDYNVKRRVPIIEWMGTQMELDMEVTHTNLRVPFLHRPLHSILIFASEAKTDPMLPHCPSFLDYVRDVASLQPDCCIRQPTVLTKQCLCGQNLY